ncbi:MAG TPA: hypothetical protein VMR96_10195 [Solirubrobacterales bacterium]|nr:hypothetical protein [Solirubrobacterales bacterium]
MSAGLPGLGLGGLFFIFSALLAPFPELWRTLRGRSDLASWRTIGRQLAQALAMIASIDLALRLTYLVLAAAGVEDPPAADEATVLPLNLIGITTVLLVLVLCGAKLAELTLRVRGGGLPQVPEVLPRVAPLRAGTFAAVAVVTWVALLAIGASQLSPLERPQRQQIASLPEQNAGPVPQQAAVKPRRQGQSDRAPIPTVPTRSGRKGAAGPPSVAAPDDGGGRAEAAPTPAVAAPTALPSPPPAGSAPIAIPEPTDSPSVGPQAATGAGAQPAPAGPPEGAPASEGAGPPAEPPPQAPAKGLRGSE